MDWGCIYVCSDFGPSAADFQTLGIQSFDCRQSDFQLVEIALVPAVASQSQSVRENVVRGPVCSR